MGRASKSLATILRKPDWAVSPSVDGGIDGVVDEVTTVRSLGYLELIFVFVVL